MQVDTLCMGEQHTEGLVQVDVCTEQTHEELKANDLAWHRLQPTRQRFVTYDFGDSSETYECRNCTCGSTLYKLVG